MHLQPAALRWLTMARAPNDNANVRRRISIERTKDDATDEDVISSPDTSRAC